MICDAFKIAKSADNPIYEIPSDDLTYFNFNLVLELKRLFQSIKNTYVDTNIKSEIDDQNFCLSLSKGSDANKAEVEVINKQSIIDELKHMLHMDQTRILIKENQLEIEQRQKQIYDKEQIAKETYTE